MAALGVSERRYRFLCGWAEAASTACLMLRIERRWSVHFVGAGPRVDLEPVSAMQKSEFTAGDNCKEE